MLPDTLPPIPFLVFQALTIPKLRAGFPGPVYCVTTRPVVGSTVSPTLKVPQLLQHVRGVTRMAAGVDEAEG